MASEAAKWGKDLKNELWAGRPTSEGSNQRDKSGKGEGKVPRY